MPIALTKSPSAQERHIPTPHRLTIRIGLHPGSSCPPFHSLHSLGELQTHQRRHLSYLLLRRVPFGHFLQRINPPLIAYHFCLPALSLKILFNNWDKRLPLRSLRIQQMKIKVFFPSCISNLPITSPKIPFAAPSTGIILLYTSQ
jgi:hypothetical protein